MKLLLTRTLCLPDRVEGKLAIDGQPQCFTLEPPRKEDNPLEDHPAIGLGTYPVHIRYSVKHQMMLPCIDRVPGRSAIEIHAGNVATETEGCVLVGEDRLGRAVIHSRDALQALMAKLAPTLARQESVTITVEELLPKGTLRA